MFKNSPSPKFEKIPIFKTDKFRKKTKNQSTTTKNKNLVVPPTTINVNWNSQFQNQELHLVNKEIQNLNLKRKATDGYILPVLKYDVDAGEVLYQSKSYKQVQLKLSNYLGGGVAGVVYETLLSDKTKAAVKILNPVAYHMKSVEDVIVIRSGEQLSNKYGSSSSLSSSIIMEEKHVYWVCQRQGLSSVLRRPEKDRGSPGEGLNINLLACYKDANGKLNEIPLTKCIEIWGHATPFTASEEAFNEALDALEHTRTTLTRASTTSTNLTKVDTEPGVVFNEELQAYINIPPIPPKYTKWLRHRRSTTKEIRTMLTLPAYPHVVRLVNVLEYIEESKSTMFFILELVNGGELFDLISSNNNSNLASSKGVSNGEGTMRKFFKQLVLGIDHCHRHGVVHRDLKPENLLVHYNSNGECTLKIADFGLSATFVPSKLPPPKTEKSDSSSSMLTSMGCDAFGVTTMKQKNLTVKDMFLSFITCGTATGKVSQYVDDDETVPSMMFCTNNNSQDRPSSPLPSPTALRRMTSVVGSPHYVAPEIISQSSKQRKKSNEGNGRSDSSSVKYRSNSRGYDGIKVDVWSAGVILYAMLFRSLPFGEDLLRCPRFVSFKKWYYEVRESSATGTNKINKTGKNNNNMEKIGPHWFFPSTNNNNATTTTGNGGDDDVSMQSKDLILCMLNPNPSQRYTIQQVMNHPWLR